MRPRSLIGPLLLIALGVLLLMNTLRPELPLLETLARYWPFLLIGWGLLRLVEISVWRLRGLPLPASGISGGEWTVIVLVCLIGSGLYALNRHRPWERMGVFASRRVELFGHNYDFVIPEQRQPAPKAPRVLVENLRGDVRVIGTDVAEIRVSGRKSIRALQESDAAQADRQTPLEITVAGDRITVRTNQDRITGDYRLRGDLEISLPRGAALEARGREGDFEISDLDGDVELASDNAGVRLHRIGGKVRLNLRRSDLVRAVDIKGGLEVIGGRGRDLEIENVAGGVTIEGYYSGDLRFSNLPKPLRLENAQTTLRVEKVPGHIQMDLGELSAARLEGPIRFTTTRPRDVELDGFTGGADIAVESGDITLRPGVPIGPIQARTRAGNITLVAPESAAFQLEARTDRGSVSNQFGPMLREQTEARGASLSGSTGQGPLISLITGRGLITVRKDTGSILRERQRPTSLEIETEGGKLRVQRH